MNRARRSRLSKFLSYVLRHRPDEIGVELDEAGWVDVDVLLERCRAAGRSVSRSMLEEVVRTSPKRRFSLSDDGARIRAAQGHSVEVELGYQPVTPPEELFHGTVAAAVSSIRTNGLEKRGRHHVHLSGDQQTATSVGSRRGKPVVLRVLASKMHRDGHTFFLSANGVWLTDHVPAKYVVFPDD